VPAEPPGRRPSAEVGGRSPCRCQLRDRNRAMRSAVGGWSLKRRLKSTRVPPSGLTMYMGAISGRTPGIGICRLVLSSLASAWASGSPSPISSAPERSAWNSRLRDRASCSRAAASGARISMASSSKMFWPWSRPWPNSSPPHAAMRASSVMAMAIVAATDAIRMSRLRTWLISWASTPRSSSHVQICRIPAVTATAAWCGLRPVAKALGCWAGDTYSRGMGIRARSVRSRTTA